MPKCASSLLWPLCSRFAQPPYIFSLSACSPHHMFASTSPSCSPSRLPSSDAFPCPSSSASILAHLCRLCHHDDRTPHRHRHHHHHHRHPIVYRRVTWAPTVSCSRQHASVFWGTGLSYTGSPVVRHLHAVLSREPRMRDCSRRAINVRCCPGTSEWDLQSLRSQIHPMPRRAYLLVVGIRCICPC